MLRLVVVLAVLAAPLAALSQSYPARPVRIVVPYSAGGAVDAATRALTARMSESIGQPVIVDNRPGATGIVGAEAVARAAPDGYTVLMTAVQHYMVQFFNKSVPYDPVGDFTPIGAVAVSPAVLVVSAALPARSVDQLIAYARSNPGKLNYGTTGIGSVQHLGGLMLAQLAGISMQHVPYKGGPPAMADIMSGQIAMGFLSASTVMPQVKAGKLRVLGLIETRRFRTVPGVPTIGESLKGYGAPETWFGMLGPASLPPPLVATLNAEIRKATQTPEVRARMEGIGFEPMSNSPDEFAASIRSDLEMIRKTVAAAGIRPE